MPSLLDALTRSAAGAAGGRRAARAAALGAGAVAAVAAGRAGLRRVFDSSPLVITIEIKRRDALPPARPVAELAPGAPPTCLVLPDVTGAAALGSLLTAGPGRWEGGPTSFRFGWQRLVDGQWRAVPSADGPAYAPSADDVGHALRVAVAAANGVPPDALAVSTPTEPIAGLPVATIAPRITGSPRAGKVLTLDRGSWTGAESVACRWQRCTPDGCVDIEGATGSYLALGSLDVGCRVRAVVTAVAGPHAVTSATPETKRIRPRR